MNKEQNRPCADDTTREPLISVIVPVYNAERYLDGCLGSLQSQTLDRIEIICVNDGSTDGSEEILRRYASRDPRFVVLSHENRGLGRTRNAGLAIARGRYIMFVDSDDYIELNSCETVFREMESESADVLMFCSYLEYDHTMIPQRPLGDQRRCFENGESQSFLFRHLVGFVGGELRAPEKQDKLTSACMKGYRRGMLTDHGILFGDNRVIGSAEDALFNIDVFAVADKCVYIPTVLYHYIRTNEASITTVYREKLHEKHARFMEEIRKRIKENAYAADHAELFERAYRNRYAISILSLGLNEANCDCSFGGKVKKIKILMNRPGYREAVKQLPLRPMAGYWKVFFLCVKMRAAFAVTLLLTAIKSLRARRKKVKK